MDFQDHHGTAWNRENAQELLMTEMADQRAPKHVGVLVLNGNRHFGHCYRRYFRVMYGMLDESFNFRYFHPIQAGFIEFLKRFRPLLVQKSQIPNPERIF